MKKGFLILAIIFISISSFSQNNVNIIKIPRGALAESTIVIDGITTHSYSSGSKIPINGVPYLYESFNPGILELYDGKKSDEVMLRYNIAKDIFEILRNNDTLTLNRPFDVKHVYLNDKVFIFNSNLREDAERKYNGFFELCVDGDLSLYIKRNKNLSYDSFTSNYQGGSGTKEYYYVDKISFVGRTSDGNTFLMNSSRSLLKNLDEHKAEIKAYIKKNKIKFKKQEDLVSVVEYYNNLL